MMKILERLLPAGDVLMAREIATKIANHYPAKVEAKLKFVGGKKRLGGVLDTVMTEVEKYQQDARMGWIRKARFGNELKWRLKEIGYSEAFVDAVAEGVVTHLATINRGKS